MRNLLIAIVALACCSPVQAATFTYGGSVLVDNDEYASENFTSIGLSDINENWDDFRWSPQQNRAYDITLTFSRRVEAAFMSSFTFRSAFYQQWDSDDILRDEFGYSWEWQGELASGYETAVMRGRYTPFTSTDERGSSSLAHWRLRERTYAHPDQADIMASEGMLDYTVTISGPVPEPAAWAMMVAGFGFVGAALRRQNISAGKIAMA